MKSTRVPLVTLLVLALGALSSSAAPPETPPGYYSIYWPAELEFWPSLQKIDTATGAGTLIAPLQIDPSPGPGLPDLWFTPFGLTFDRDGMAYTMVNWLGFDANPDNAWARLATIDMMTGAVEYIGPLHHMNFAGPEIDACGDFYVTGFEVGAPETGGEPKYLFGDSNLYKIHKKTGAVTVIGDTGRTDWMDLEFDRQGRLWATTRNELYRIDTETAAATLVTPIHGVPTSDIPGTCAEDWEWMEVMSIAFDKQGVLWGTAMKGFSWCADNNSPVLRIDTQTGNATLVGYTGSVPFEGGFNHGGDIVLGPGGRCAD